MRSNFVTDLNEIRRRAREHVEAGAVTEHYNANREVVLKLLNEALATELVCVLRYKCHYFKAQGLYAEPIAEEFEEHAKDEQEHADRIAARIIQLGGTPNYSPEGILSRSASEYVEGNSLVDMIREDLVAERIVIDTYKDMIHFLAEDDPTTRRMLEDILATEEEHADDLANMLSSIDGKIEQ